MSPGLLRKSPTEPIAISATLRASPCTPADARELGAIFAGMEPWSRYPFTACALETYLASDETGAPRYAIRLQNRLAGALGLRLNWLRGPYIQFFGMVPGAQGEGAGSHVLDKLVEDARTSRERNLWVAASAFNTGAIRFYERHGFVRVAELDGLMQEGIDEILLRKRL